MKKIIVLLITLGIFFSNIDFSEAKKTTTEETRAVFVSYMELNKYVKNENQEISKKNINKIISNIKKMNFNTIILY